MGIAFIYAAYLAVSIGLTVIVASALFRSGRVYLAGVFGGDEGMGTAVNRMLVVGFCLLSLGYAALTLRTSADIHGPGQAVGVLSVKVGEELLVLGALLLVNMMFFSRLRRRQPVAGRPGAPASGRRAADWPRGTISGRPAAVDRPDTAAVTGQPSGTDWSPAAAASGRPVVADLPEAAAITTQPRAAGWPTAAAGPGAPAADRQTAATITGQPSATDRPTAAAGYARADVTGAPTAAITGQVGATGWPGAGDLATAGPGRRAAAWPAPPAAREVLH